MFRYFRCFNFFLRYLLLLATLVPISKISLQTKKKKWGRKCVRNEIFRNVEVKPEGGERCAICNGQSYAKNITLIFFIQQFKKPVFSEKTVKNCFRGIFSYFLGKGGV